VKDFLGWGRHWGEGFLVGAVSTCTYCSRYLFSKIHWVLSLVFFSYVFTAVKMQIIIIVRWYASAKIHLFFDCCTCLNLLKYVSYLSDFHNIKLLNRIEMNTATVNKIIIQFSNSRCFKVLSINNSIVKIRHVSVHIISPNAQFTLLPLSEESIGLICSFLTVRILSSDIENNLNIEIKGLNMRLLEHQLSILTVK